MVYCIGWLEGVAYWGEGTETVSNKRECNTSKGLLQNIRSYDLLSSLRKNQRKETKQHDGS